MAVTFRLICFLALPIFSAQAASIVVIQGNDSPFGRRYFCGFSSMSTEKISAFQYDAKKTQAILAQIQKLAPDLIFTIGEVPVQLLAEKLPSTPLIVSDYYSAATATKANVVSMESSLPVDAGIHLASLLFPARKTLGTIYNPEASQASFDALVKKSGSLGLKMASLKVHSAQEVASFISAFEGKIDLYYWIRDSVTADDSSLAAIYDFSSRHAVPVITLDPGQLGRGAALAVALDPSKLGEQAWKVAQMIIKEKTIPQMPVRVQPGQLTIAVSMKAMEKYGVTAEGLKTFLKKATDAGYGAIRVEP